jgi:flagellin
MLSVNTNVGAYAALQSLNKTSTALESTQRAVSTGLRVSSAKDSGAYFAIGQDIRSDIRSNESVTTSLNRGKGVIGTAIAAAEAISDVLTEMKALTTAAQDSSLSANDKTNLATEYTQLYNQISTISAAAEFSGKNLVKSSPDTAGIVASVTSGGVASSISVAGKDISNTGLSLTAALGNGTTAAGTLDTAITTVGTELAKYGAASKRLEIQSAFSTKLTDSLREGLGAIVDADLARESATLQSLQIKQQLGAQALGIANQSPQVILGFF